MNRHTDKNSFSKGFIFSANEEEQSEDSEKERYDEPGNKFIITATFNVIALSRHLSKEIPLYIGDAATISLRVLKKCRNNNTHKISESLRFGEVREFKAVIAI